MPAAGIADATVSYDEQDERTPWVVKVRGVEVTRTANPEPACNLVRDVRCSRVMAAHMPTVRPSADVPVW